MTDDLTQLLKHWPYRPDTVNARKLIGLDGREKVQMRVDLGIIQMEASGRPDGRRPQGMESLLEYHLTRLEIHRRQHGGDVGFTLSTSECKQLRDEGTQYYLRYLSLFHCSDYQSVVRDTNRNLQLFDLVRAHAAEDDDRRALEQYRPYVLMMNTRAHALMASDRKEYRRALELVDEGITRISDYLESLGEVAVTCREIEILREFADQLKADKPPTEEDILRDELRDAVAREDYELAARLRDQLRALGVLL